MLLRLTQHDVGERGDNRHRVEVRLEGDGAPWVAESELTFGLTAQDEEDVRWYLEDFLQFPQEPAPTIAKRVEGRIQEIGKELFRGVFQASDEARDLWAQVRDRLAGTRIEVVTGVAAAVSVPWELLRDPRTDFPVALTARSFVRAQPRAPLRAQLGNGAEGPARILVVLCRPMGGEDVPFRSVASRLIKGLDEERRAVYDLDLLRPPTFEQLGKTLRRARAEGRPYHVVHFDGHGMYGEPGDFTQLVQRMSPVQLMSAAGPHGFLAFENPELDDNLELIGGPALGRLLHETGVPVLVLNACRSAHNEAPEKPEDTAAEGGDHHSQVRAFGSLAQEVMEAGVGGVVAMRYNVWVVTAAQMVGELYAALARGQELGEAVTTARKNLAERPLRAIAAKPLALQDWQVPVVYEAAPLRIFPVARDVEAPNFQVERKRGTGGGEEGGALPPPPDVGFYGRDETLLALDRAFDRDQVVLLHAYAGSGKTTTAAEFARWYLKTGGVDGPVLFTSFERYLPLPRVLDVVGQVFSPYLESGGVNWLALDDVQRRHVALQVFEQVPVLWVWDNVEPVAGFPAGTPSAWSAEEQRELVDFLRDLKGTKAKVLLTSRREERGWLGDLPSRIWIPAMPMLERLQLARAIAEKRGEKLAEVDWRPLLEYTQGNPLTLTVLVGQALRDGLRSKEQVAGFVAKLRAGEGGFADEVGEGRSKSLGASLAYGLERAFSEEERRRLAVLALFQGFVQIGALQLMHSSDNGWCAISKEWGQGRDEWFPLLNRATEVGLLAAYGDGCFSIHPVLPWFFRELFEKYYPSGELGATRAYVGAINLLATFYHMQYEQGNRDASDSLQAEEANLLQAHYLALRHSWWPWVVGTMQGLRTLYGHTARRAEWKRLVEEVVPYFVDQRDGPIPGREDEWSLVTEFRVRLAVEERKLTVAERLQIQRVEWDRQQALEVVGLDSAELTGKQRHSIRCLVASLSALGYIYLELGRADCSAVYKEALVLAERIGDRNAAAVCANNLGRAALNIPALHNLEQADHWYQLDLELTAEQDQLGRARTLCQLGFVALSRLDKATASEDTKQLGVSLLKSAIQRFHAALDHLPANALDDLAIVYNALGAGYLRAQMADQALYCLRKAIQLRDTQGEFYEGSKARYNVALAYVFAGQQADALEYANAALRGFELYGDRAAEMIRQTQKLIETIQATPPASD